LTINQPKFTRYEDTAQEKLNERKIEEKQVQRLLAILARKVKPSSRAEDPASAKIA
jgi:hypothetical protein